MVPEGWTRKILGDVVDFLDGKRIPLKSEDRALRRGPYPYYGATGVIDWIDDYIFDDHLILLGEDGENILSRALPHAFEVRGKTWVNNHAHVLKCRGEMDATFLTAWLVEVDYRPFNTGSTQPKLNKAVCQTIPVLVPPLPEQQKIAEILSTWDRAIQTTEALLANARTQKRALMQSLLTGTRRFPGFEDHPWREVRLQQIADIIVSNVDKKSEPDELPVRLCNYTDVYKNDTIRADMDFMEATATPAQIKKFGLKVGDVIITKDSEDPSDIAVPAYVAETAADLVCGYHLAIIRANDHADGRFLKYCFELPHTRYYFGARANGATRFGLNIDSIETAVFQVPSVAEQRNIADAIEVVEQEIGQTISTLDHLRTEKKSLMQQLLTGKRRVAV